MTVGGYLNRNIVVNGVAIDEDVYDEMGRETLFAGLSSVDTYVLAQAAANDYEWGSTPDWQTEDFDEERSVAPFTSYSLDEEEVARVKGIDPSETCRHFLFRTSGKDATKMNVHRFESAEALNAEVEALDARIAAAWAQYDMALQTA